MSELVVASQAGRDTSAERRKAKANLAVRVGDIVASRHEGALGEEVIRLAQAMVLCSLPYSPTSETKITRRARLGDGTTLSVTFSAGDDGVAMPYGADRKLLAWIYDRAIRLNSPVIPWTTVNDYRAELGLTTGGSANRQLAAQFKRVAGLHISIQRQGAASGDAARRYAVMQDSKLPTSLLPSVQTSLPGLGDRYGMVLSPGLFEDISRYFVCLPRELWRDIKAPNQVLDIVHWLFYRSHSANSETIIPWEALREQFDPEQLLWRVKVHAREAVKLVATIWPKVRLEVVSQGIWVAYTPEALLPDDHTKGRQRRLRSAV